MARHLSTRARRAETRERIIQAAVRTLAVEGYKGTTARSVARTGGFTPGVIYYHFDDLEDLLIATMQYTSRSRLEHYRDRLATAVTATELVRRLRELHAEDEAEGHISAVQELVAAASSSPRLAGHLRAQIRPWQDFAEGTMHQFLAPTPLNGLVPVRDLAAAAVALFLGMEMLAHLDESPTEAFFRAAEPAAVFFDSLAGRESLD